MEDILASIRRILSEDEVEDKGAAPAAEPPPEPEPEPVAMPEPEPEPLPQDDIDALFAQAAPEPEPVFDVKPVFELEDEDDVLELTDDMVLEEPEPAFDINEFKPDIGDFDFEPEPEPIPIPIPIPQPPPRMMAVEEDPLVSEPVARHSTSLLSDLAREIVRHRAIGIGQGGITLEDMVRELLKPILKEWLDDNLPYMIERIVKQEIEKMVNRAENL